jgi:hypothetical protein
MKTLSKMAMVLAFFVAATMARADDAAIKQKLLGYWSTGRHVPPNGTVVEPELRSGC